MTTGESRGGKPRGGIWEEVGLTREEYGRIVEILGREPNYLELGLYGLMWSEHCSYKTSRVHLKQLPTTGRLVVQGPGENAGAIDIGDGMILVFKMESHNHPSAIEPYQGAATGVGGILRDIFTMGARPIALLDSLRFGELADDRVRYLFGGVVAGIAGYGNTTGIPTVGGEVYFEDCYRNNCLVNVMCLGIVEKGKIIRGRAAGEGNAVMLVGARTGRDGIHGASLLASRQFDERAEEMRPAVQVGDPFMEKLLIEACLELAGNGYVVGINDLGAAGLASACSEMASRGNSGLDIDVALVPRREVGMSPYEVMLSESQERMLVIIQRGYEEEARKIFSKWGLNSVVLGRVTGDGMLRVRENGAVVAEVPARSLTEEGPVYRRPMREPAYLATVQAFNPAALPEPEDFNAVLGRLVGSPNIASKEWVYRQYDHMVRTNTVVLPGSDAAVLRIKGTPRGIALGVDGNGRYCYLDPYRGGAIAVAEAARNVSCSGAEPVAITNCLNFGNPERPEIMWQFRQVIEGMAEACRALDTPVTGGNVSFYNETMGENIYPTPIVGMVGLLEDVERRCTQGFKSPGDLVVLLGETREELGGSEYLKVVFNRVTGSPPALDLDLERRVQRCCREAIREGIARSAHDCAEGGLAVALAECCFTAAPGAGGASITLDDVMRRDALLFGESQSRIILSVSPGDLVRLRELASAHRVPLQVLGEVGGDRLTIAVREGGRAGRVRNPVALVDLPVSDLEKRWRGTIPWAMK